MTEPESIANPDAIDSSLQSMNINEHEPNGTAGTTKQKVDILLKPTGNAPIMKKKKWTVDSDKPIGWIIEFIKKYIKLDPNEKLVRFTNTDKILIYRSS